MTRNKSLIKYQGFLFCLVSFLDHIWLCLGVIIPSSCAIVTGEAGIGSCGEGEGTILVLEVEPGLIVCKASILPA